jgi:AAA family ATP:ADP antiporter
MICSINLNVGFATSARSERREILSPFPTYRDYRTIVSFKFSMGKRCLLVFAKYNNPEWEVPSKSCLFVFLFLNWAEFNLRTAGRAEFRTTLRPTLRPTPRTTARNVCEQRNFVALWTTRIPQPNRPLVLGPWSLKPSSAILRMPSPAAHAAHFPPAWLGRLLERVVDAREDEIKAMLCGFAWFFCLLSGYYLLRPLRDAMGLVGGAGHLQWLFTATFFSMLALVPVFGAVASRWPPRRFVPLIYRFFALNILGFGWLFASGAQSVLLGGIFFVWISVFNLFAVSIFWSVLADHFNSEQGRRLFGFIAAGGTAGALVGPALAALLAVKAGIAVLAVLSAILLEAAVHCFRGLDRNAPCDANGKRHADDSRIAGGIFAGIQLILRDRYLLAIVVYLLLHSLASTFLYFEQGRLVASALKDTATRTQLFAVADFAVSCITLLLQLFVTGRFLRRFGVVAALVLLPLASLLAYGAIAAWPVLAVLVAVQSLRRALDYAIARPGREVLFTVVSREAKYKAKNVIETVVFRGGDAATGWLFAGFAAAGIGFGAMALASLPVVAGWSALALWLAREQERKAGPVAQGRTGETTSTTRHTPAPAAINRRPP